MAVGKAIDGVLSQFGYELRQGRKPTLASLTTHAASLLDEAVEEAAVPLTPEAREAMLLQVRGILQLYRKSEIAGLPRPRTRVILLDGRVGVYAQPDYWDGKRRIFEMKSYRALPPPPDVSLQVRLFQLAFPSFEAHLVCFNRHADPVELSSFAFPPPTPQEAETALRLAYDLGREFGQEKVLEYVEGPFVHYQLPPQPAAPPSPGPQPTDPHAGPDR